MKQYKQVKFRSSSWKKLRRQFYGRLNETYSDYIERIAEDLERIHRTQRIKPFTIKHKK